MKKSIFILAALFAATFANAQITYEGFFKGLLSSCSSPYIIGDLLGEKEHPQAAEAPYIVGINYNQDSIYFFNKEDFSLYKTIKIQGIIRHLSSVQKGVYTTDPNMTCFVVKNGDHVVVMDENGQEVTELLAGFDNRVTKTEIVKIGDSYKLLVTVKETGTYIYSLPGNGEAQDVETPVVPRNARKILKKDQVFIENSDHIYDAQGKMVK